MIRRENWPVTQLYFAVPAIVISFRSSPLDDHVTPRCSFDPDRGSVRWRMGSQKL